MFYITKSKKVQYSQAIIVFAFLFLLALPSMDANWHSDVWEHGNES